MQSEDGWWRFLDLCLESVDSKELNELLRYILTPSEREEIASRYLITKELVKGKLTQRQISETLEVSIAKITRGSNSLKEISPSLRSFLVKHIE
jgi:TrpR family transcriptional regulator, trp operon repressor